jgi:hypothetical protein
MAYPQLSIYQNGKRLPPSEPIKIKRGATLRIIASLRVPDADMDDIDRVPDEAGVWVDSLVIGDSIIVKCLQWNDPAASIDTTGESYILFYQQDSFHNADNFPIQIIDPGPTETVVNEDQIVFQSIGQNNSTTYGFTGLTIADEDLQNVSLESDQIGLTNINGNFSVIPGSLSLDDGAFGTSMSILEPGSLALGVSDPRAALHIKQGASPGLAIENDGDGNDTYLFNIQTNDLHVYYDADGPGTDSVPVDIAELDNSSGAWQANSDVRLKKAVERLEPVLDKVLQLLPSSYLYKHQDEHSKKEIGFIAQEIREVFPDLVKHSESGYYRLNYDNFGVIAIKAIQEQQQIIKSYQTELAGMKKEMAQIKKQMEHLLNQEAKAITRKD